MKTLVIPDIHENIPKLLPWLDVPCDRRVFLGDWFDTFGPHRVEETIAVLKAQMEDESNSFIWGNHDCMYAMKNQAFMCSGYHPLTRHLVECANINWHRFKVSLVIDGVLLSHAGYHPETLVYRGQEDNAITMGLNGGYHSLWEPGVDSGGRAPLGGPTWLRWWNFIDLDKLPQIVGHTPDKKVRVRGNSYCIDTSLRNAALIEDGKITIL